MITGLTINRPSNSRTGLFGKVVGDGSTKGIISNVDITGTVVGSSRTGGIVGSAIFATISGSSFQGDVSGRFRTGGLVGYAEDSDISGYLSWLLPQLHQGHKKIVDKEGLEALKELEDILGGDPAMLNQVISLNLKNLNREKGKGNSSN